MSVSYTPWPADLAATYRAKGYWRDEPLTSVVTDHARRPATADAPAVICRDRTFTYRDLDRLSDRLAEGLRRRGLRSGDTALVQLPNRAEFYIAFLALLKCGAVGVNALFNHGRFELTAYVEQIAPRVAILSNAHPLLRPTGGDDGAASFLADLEAAMGGGRLLIQDDASPAEGTAALDAFAWSDGTPLDLRGTGGIDPGPEVPEVAFFQLSGGSTGTPKLIPRTHNDYLYSIRQSVAVCDLDASCRYLCALPAPHNFSLSSPGALGVFLAGGTVILAGDPSPATCFDLIERHRPTWAAVVPPVLSLWLTEAPRSGADLSSLDVLQVGGAKLSPATAERVAPELGCRLQQVFGMAEGLVNYTRLDDAPRTIVETQGRPMSPDDEVRILDPHGLPVAPGAVGELWTRGPYTFRGYYNAPLHNARVFDDEGFYSSGDLVRMTGDGNLIVCGRSKDQINRGGEKIDAQEVEDVLAGHEAVHLAAVVAMPDDLMGERSCAFVLAREGTKASALRRFLRDRGLADYKLPDKVVFVTDLPKTAVGKVDKQTLRDRLAPPSEAPVARAV